MKQHILVISQYFYPEQFRINDICKELVKRGCEVTVITGIPNYPQGKYFKGYGLWKRRKEEYEGIHIIRLPLIPRGNNAILLILNYLSFVVSGFFWKSFTRVKADKVFVFEVSPMTQALPGVWYANKCNKPCFIYVQDLWPENIEAVAGIHNKYIISIIDKMVDYIYANCKKIFTTSPSFANRIKERKSAWFEKQSKVAYWPQYAEEFYQPIERGLLPDVEDDDSFKIVFTGNIGFAQGLDILPQIAEQLKKKQFHCCFYIIGEGRYQEHLKKKIEEKRVSDMFRFLGRKRAEDISAYMAHFDAAFLSLADEPLLEMTIPAKLQSYMACGMPIIAAAKGETQRIIEKAKCGIIFKRHEISEVAKVICETNKEQWDEWGKMSMKYSRQVFDKDVLMDYFLTQCE